MREARRSQWPPPLASRATKQTAQKAPSLRVAVKCGVCVVALLGFVVLATTFVARLASIRILPATQSAEDLIGGSLSIKWLSWGYWLFIISGIIWITVLIPVQIMQAKMVRQFADGGDIPDRNWMLGRLWNIFGILATVIPLANLYWMVFKPV